MLHNFNCDGQPVPNEQATRQMKAEAEAMKKVDEWMQSQLPEMYRAAIWTAFDVRFYEERGQDHSVTVTVDIIPPASVSTIQITTTIE